MIEQENVDKEPEQESGEATLPSTRTRAPRGKKNAATREPLQAESAEGADDSSPREPENEGVQDGEQVELETLPDIAFGDAANEGIVEADAPGLSKVAPVAISGRHLKSILESLVFVSDRPVTAQHLAKVTRSKAAEVKAIMEDLKLEYHDRGLELVEVGSGYQFRSAAMNAPFVRDFVAQRPVRLSRAQLEALSIISYRQPVTRPELEDIRGVDSGSALKVLLDRELVKIVGKKEDVGRPLLYGTTPTFLEFFGMKSLADLPSLREFTDLSEESRGLFERRSGEPYAPLVNDAVPASAVGESNGDVEDDDGLDREVVPGENDDDDDTFVLPSDKTEDE